MAQLSSVFQRFLARPNQLGVVAAGFCDGGPKRGPEAGPSALINSGLLVHLRNQLQYGIDLSYCVTNNAATITGLDPDLPGTKRPHSVSRFTQSLSQQVYNHARRGRLVLTLGGDHSIAIGTLTGTAKANRERLNLETAVVYVDAHSDINTPRTSSSGYIHGMPVAFATGLAKNNNKGLFGWIGKEHLVNVKKLVYIGLRDVDYEEWKIIHEHGIKTFSMEEVRRTGIEKIMDMAITYIGDKTPIHLSYDIDALDPEWAPSTVYPVSGGLTFEEGTYIARRIHGTGSLVAMDLVEINPSIEARRVDLTLEVGCSLILSALGATVIR